MSFINSATNTLLFTIAFSFTVQLNSDLVTVKIHQTSHTVCPPINIQSQSNNNSPFTRDKKPGGGHLFENYTS